MQNENVDNYAKVIGDWEKKAVTWDYDERCKTLGLSGCEKDAVTVLYYGRPYRIHRGTGAITSVEDPEERIPFSVKIDIYHLFYYSKEQPKLSGEWVPLHSIPGAGVFQTAFQNQYTHPCEKFFEGRTELLKAAGEKLGFKPIKYSDVGFEADIFECLPIRFLFWDGDEEFPAKLNVLFDSNIVDFMHNENVVMVAGDGLELLQRTAEEIEKGTGSH